MMKNTPTLGQICNAVGFPAAGAAFSGARIKPTEFQTRAWNLFLSEGRFLEINGLPFTAAKQLHRAPTGWLT